jgi:polyphosphate glucokinase
MTTNSKQTDSTPPPAAIEATDQGAAASAPPPPATSSGPQTLCLDIGGTGIKAIVLDVSGKELSERQRIATPRPATPAAVLAVIKELIHASPSFDRISVGFPGVVKNHTVFTAVNLDPSWVNYSLGAELEALTGKPTRVLNDAGVQGFGAIKGEGVELIITLGTGMGFALFVNGTYVPNIELAHHPLRKGRTYEEYVSDEALKEVGRKRWNRRVRRVLKQILPIFNPDIIYVGGGNARHLKGDLPEQVRVVENIAGLLGGIALWQHDSTPHPAT